MTKLLKWRVGEEAGDGLPWAETNPQPAGNKPLLEVGQQITTPKGEATIKSIGLQTLTVGPNQLQLDMPKVVVHYIGKNEEGNVEEEVVCLCKVTLHDPDLNKLLQKEVARLWPPLPEEPAKPKEEQHAEKVERYEVEATAPKKSDIKRWKEALGVASSVVTPKEVAQTLYHQHKLVATAKAHLAVATTASLLTDEPHKDWYTQAEQVIGRELEQLAIAKLGRLVGTSTAKHNASFYKEKFTDVSKFQAIRASSAHIAKMLYEIKDDLTRSKLSPGTKGSAAATLYDCSTALETLNIQIHVLERRNFSALSVPPNE